MSLPFTEKNAVNPLDAAAVSRSHSPHLPSQYETAPGSTGGTPPHETKAQNPIPQDKFADLYSDMDDNATANDKTKPAALPTADQLRGVVNNVVKFTPEQEALAERASSGDHKALAQLVAETSQASASQAAALAMQGSKMFNDQQAERNSNDIISRTRLDSKLSAVSDSVFSAMPKLDRQLGGQVLTDIVTRMHKKYPDASTAEITEYAKAQVSQKFNIESNTKVIERSPTVETEVNWLD